MSDNDVIKKPRAKGLGDCSLQCHCDVTCRSFYYSNEDKGCEAYSVTVTSRVADSTTATSTKIVKHTVPIANIDMYMTTDPTIRLIYKVSTRKYTKKDAMTACADLEMRLLVVNSVVKLSLVQSVVPSSLILEQRRLGVSGGWYEVDGMTKWWDGGDPPQPLSDKLVQWDTMESPDFLQSLFYTKQKIVRRRKKREKVQNTNDERVNTYSDKKDKTEEIDELPRTRQKRQEWRKLKTAKNKRGQDTGKGEQDEDDRNRTKSDESVHTTAHQELNRNTDIKPDDVMEQDSHRQTEEMEKRNSEGEEDEDDRNRTKSDASVHATAHQESNRNTDIKPDDVMEQNSHRQTEEMEKSNSEGEQDEDGLNSTKSDTSVYTTPHQESSKNIGINSTDVIEQESYRQTEEIENSPSGGKQDEDDQESYQESDKDDNSDRDPDFVIKRKGSDTSDSESDVKDSSSDTECLPRTPEKYTIFQKSKKSKFVSQDQDSPSPIESSNISTAINRTWTSAIPENSSSISATKIRKLTVTEVRKRFPDSRDSLASHMSHRPSTADAFYVLHHRKQEAVKVSRMIDSTLQQNCEAEDSNLDDSEQQADDPQKEDNPQEEINPQQAICSSASGGSSTSAVSEREDFYSKMAATMFKCATCGVLIFTREGFMAHACTDTPASASIKVESASTSTSDTAGSSTNNKLTWTDSKSRTLLHLYKDRLDGFNSFSVKNKGLWEEIKNIINKSTNSSFTTTQVEGRYKTILAAYRKYKDNMKKTGAARKDFQFRTEMDEIMGDSHSITPKFVFGSAELAGPSTSAELAGPRNISSDSDGHDSGDDILQGSDEGKRKKKGCKKQFKKKRTSGAIQMIEFLDFSQDSSDAETVMVDDNETDSDGTLTGLPISCVWKRCS
ncbi:dentin sialophosphoprotein-like [Mizuhopecten yessoensis]|uniref:dentin sialophosphoprotein-like n=1 Tax=Mizuhopecten yessoensis TaxID=6573 RepID=UPI000B458E04|nr:dentin sialophosphoprotein-like [Mizuhopecten yessoensis]